MNTGKPDTSRINMALYGGLAGLLANREYLAAEYVVDLSDTELDNLLELSEVASRRLGFILETVGRLLEHHAALPASQQELGAAESARLSNALMAELGAALPYLHELSGVLTEQYGFRQGFQLALSGTQKQEGGKR